jgi:hypothetical protein
MTWDDVATQMRALVDAVPPVEADEVIGRPARPAPSGPHVAGWWKPVIGIAAAVVLIAGATWLVRSDDAGTSDADVSVDGADDTPTGPLALAEPETVIAEAAFRGRLRITDGCTFLGDHLLVWPADRTSWSSAAGAIVFDPVEGGRVELHDGEQISIGGAGRDTTGPGAEGLEPIDWVVEPRPSCPRDHMWIVGASAQVLG